jgi:ferredoxin--NADP+ reductase
VPNGPLTSELQKIVPGDTVLLRQKSTGTLVNDALSPAKRLYMIATGTGIAPFASLIRDPDTYEKFDEIVLTNTCRDVAELAYGDELIAALRADPLIGELVAGRVRYYPTTTREDGERTGRITTLIESGKLFSDLGVAPFDPASDRVMICGSLDMIRDVKALVEKSGLVEGSNAAPADFVVERAFVG